ncbi:hypothetical protein [Saccharopolyspora sp. NPDC002376]
MSLDQLREIMTDPAMLMEYAVRAYADANGVDPSSIRGAVVTFTAPDREFPELMHNYMITPVESAPPERLRTLREAVAQVEEEIRTYDEQMY